PRERMEPDEITKMKDRIYDDIIGMVTDMLAISPTDIHPETTMIDDLGLDSLQMYEMVIDLEGAYDIRIPDESLEKVTMVKDVVDLVYQLTTLN
ncbi:MAG TPA: phosphopantetheine-binding protein, partial [Bacillota bacterium]|nr:phosphopantetheine-binding protein [Bacillota bacterium]